MNEEMSKRLSAYVVTDTLVSFYTDTEDPESFTLGYLLQMDKDYALVNMIDSLGEENGFTIINMNEIYVFVADKMYSQKIQKLLKFKKQERRYIENTDINSIICFLKYAASNKLLIIVNEDDNFIGHVVDFSKDTLILQLFDSYGSDVGTAVIDINNVNTLDCQTKYLKSLELLVSN
jgi:hypothetical protein